MKTFLKLCAAASAAFFATFALADTYALNIGISDYPDVVDANGDPILDENGEEISDDLNGCVNDANLYKKLLVEKYGVPEENILMLLDKDATETNFIAALKWLLEKAQPGDTVFISFSGHGAQYPVDDQPEEEDGLEEVLVLYDTMVTDDFIGELNKLLVDTGRNTVFVMDSCYSGGISKDFGSGELLGKKLHSIRDRWTDGERILKAKSHGMFTKEEEAALLSSAKTPRSIEKGSYLFVMAGQENQLTTDVQFVDDDPPAQGIFTFIFVIILMEDPSLSIEEAIETVAYVLKDADFDQVPKFEASDSARPTKPLLGG